MKTGPDEPEQEIPPGAGILIGTLLLSVALGLVIVAIRSCV